MPNSRETDEANLALLIRDVHIANTDAEKDAATEALQEYSENTSFSNLGTRAEAAIAIASAATRQKSMKEMKRLLDDVSDLDEAFKTAARVAADGEKNLFFPRLASSLCQVETLLASLKEQFESLGSEIENLSDGVDLAKLKDLAKSVKRASSEISKSLEQV